MSIITLNGIEYTPVVPTPTGNRVVAVLDRGWIFAGDLSVMPDGKYKLFFEEMENIYPTFPEGPLGMVEFEKGPSAATLMPPDMAPYKNLKIVIEPTAR